MLTMTDDFYTALENCTRDDLYQVAAKISASAMEYAKIGLYNPSKITPTAQQRQAAQRRIRLLSALNEYLELLAETLPETEY